MVAKIFMIASAAIILALGLIHLAYTFYGRRFNPLDPSLEAAMRRVSDVLLATVSCELEDSSLTRRSSASVARLFASTPKKVETVVPTSNARIKRAASGRRLQNRHERSIVEIGRARIGSPLR